MKLERKIQNLMLIVSIPIILMIIIFTYLLSLQNHYDVIQEESHNLISAIHKDIQSDIDELKSLVLLLSKMNILKGNTDNFTNYLTTDEDTFLFEPSIEEQKIIQFFHALKESNLYINSVYFAGVDGSFVRSHPRGKNTQYDPRTRDWYQTAIASPNEVILTDPYSSLTTKDINIGFEKAVLDDTGKLLGVVGLDITLENLNKYTNTLLLSLDGVLEIIYNNELVIASKDSERLMQEPLYDLGSYAVKLTSNVKKSYLSFTDSFEGSLMTYVILIPQENLYLASFIARKEIIFLLLLLLIALIITNFYTIKTNIVQPMNQLVLHIQQSSGTNIDFNTNIFEFDQVTHSFNQLLKEVASANHRILHSKNIVIRSLANLSEGRDAATGNHIYRVQVLTKILMLQLVKKGSFLEQITPEYIDLVTECSPLHDIGKVAIKDSILLKPGALTKEEFEEIKLHPIYGFQALNSFDQEASDDYEVDDFYISIAKEIVLSHHERYDGSGYPKGLKEDEIPLSAQIVGIVDVYEALTSQRIYKPPYTHEEAIEIITKKEASKYHPLILAAFIDCSEEFRAVKAIATQT